VLLDAYGDALGGLMHMGIEKGRLIVTVYTERPAERRLQVDQPDEGHILWPTYDVEELDFVETRVLDPKTVRPRQSPGTTVTSLPQ
jgi:hypothetical protein